MKKLPVGTIVRNKGNIGKTKRCPCQDCASSNPMYYLVVWLIHQNPKCIQTADSITRRTVHDKFEWSDTLQLLYGDIKV